jgi:FAD/FMN-containing dehydrogenase
VNGGTVLNDASGLSETPIHKHIVLKETNHDQVIASFRAELKNAAANGRPVNIGAARHSMGGHSIPTNGHAITLDNGALEIDTANETYRAPAGTRWHQVIQQLDPIGFGPKVMQSNNDFGLASTFCVNAHGWPVPFGPMGSTVRSVDMVLADGSLVTCSRTENTDLFNHAMGGYGLTGLIVRMDVEMEKNQRLVPTYAQMPAQTFAPAMMSAVNDPSVTMAYGRLNVDRDGFFEKSLLITYRADEDQSELPAAATSGMMSKIAGKIYRAQLGNERMKRFRWGIETDVGPRLSGATTRNSLINEPVVTLDDKDPFRTDILHEYFIAPDRFNEFLAVCQDVIPASFQEFLNVTLRYIAPDKEAMLSYAPVARIAAVMSFSQEMTQRGEADMGRMTHALIEGISAIGGTYYLPYRPHATIDQLIKAYPRVNEFVTQKRSLDPQLVLRNGFWDRYLEQL